MITHTDIPLEVRVVAETLENAGYEAYLVGGCVRDLLLGKQPKDWDITTNAKPEQIISLFQKTLYENNFGTVAVIYEDEQDNVKHVTNSESSEENNKNCRIIEVTPYRLDANYSDHRRPDGVIFSDNLDDDLKRRDFTINAMAYDTDKEEVVDPFFGLADLAKGVIKCVGIPNERLNEDGLRILRAIRFHVELKFVKNKSRIKSRRLLQPNG